MIIEYHTPTYPPLTLVHCFCLLICHSFFLLFQVIHCTLLYDIVRKLVDGFTERDIEMLLLILKSKITNYLLKYMTAYIDNKN